MSLPQNLTLVYVRGKFLTESGAPQTGKVSFTPNAAVVVDQEAATIIRQSATTVTLDGTGAFSVALFATDDPQLSPTAWSYRVIEPGVNSYSNGRSYYISTPISTPIIDDPTDPLDGERVVELADVVPLPAAPAGVGQLLRGVGIASVENGGSGNLIVRYTDGSSQTLPNFGGGGGDVASVNGRVGVVTGLAEQSDLAALASSSVAASDLIQEIVNRQVADQKLQYKIDQRYRFNPAVGIPESDLAAQVQAKLDSAGSSTPGSSLTVIPRNYLGDRHVASDAAIAESKLALATDAAAATPSRRTLGTGPRQAMPGNTIIPVAGTDVAPLDPTTHTVPTIYLPSSSQPGAPVDPTSKPQPLGVATPGVSTSSSPADHVHSRLGIPLPADNGLISWSFDPATANSTGTVTAGVLQLIKLWVPASTVTGVILSAITGGTSLANCYTALFDSSKNLLGQSADRSSLWSTTTGDKKGDLVTPVTITTAGYYFAGFWIGSGTSPGWAKASSQTGGTPGNVNVTGTALRFSTSTSGLTTTAPSTAGTQSGIGTSYFIGLY